MRWFLLGCLLVILIAIPTILPLFESGLMAAHDTPIHITRFTLFTRALEAGHIPPRWAGELLYGYGYPLFVFLYPLPNMIAAVMHWSGFSFPDAFEASAALTMILAALGMFLWARSWWGFWGGLLAALAYTYAPYHAVDLYVRGSIGELWSLALFPWVMWAGQRVAYHPNGRSIAVFAFLLSGLILSHNILAILIMPVVVLWIVIQGKYLLAPIVSVMFALGMTSFFWAPALWEKHLTIIDQAIRGEFFYADHFVYPLQLFRYSPWGFGGSKPGPIDGMSFYLQWPWMVAFLLSSMTIFFWRRDARKILFVSIGITGIAAFFALTWSKPIWDIFSSVFFLIQYPWRFLSIVIGLGAFSIGGLVGWRKVFPLQKQWIIQGLLVVVFALLMIWKGLPLFRVGPESGIDGSIYSEDMTIAAQTTTYADEHLPIWVKEKPSEFPTHRVELIDGVGSVQLFEDKPRSIIADINLQQESTLRIHKFYYPGWRIFLDDTMVKPTYDNIFGAMDVSISPGQYRLRAVFSETPFRTVVNIISLLSFMGVIVAFFFNRHQGSLL